MTQLPEKFSAGIRLAVADMKKCAKSSRYKIEMGFWHQPMGYETDKGVKDVCFVCMGGAVMSKTLKVSPSLSVLPYKCGFDSNIYNKIMAFDMFRQGCISFSLDSYSDVYISTLTVSEIKKEAEPYYTYDESPSKFYKWALSVADALEKRGY